MSVYDSDKDPKADDDADGEGRDVHTVEAGDVEVASLFDDVMLAILTEYAMAEPQESSAKVKKPRRSRSERSAVG
jgi:hypothetical protein